MEYKQIDKIEVVQLDVSSNSQETIRKVEEDLNTVAEAHERNGYQVIGEDLVPQRNAIRAIANMYFEKRDSVVPTRYCYAILDSRNGFGVVGKMLNEKLLEEKKKENKIIRKLMAPQTNDAFYNLLLVVEPVNSKPKKEPKKEAEKPKEPEEVKEDAREEKPSEAITA